MYPISKTGMAVAVIIMTQRLKMTAITRDGSVITEDTKEYFSFILSICGK